MKSNQSIQAIELEKENWVGAISPPFLVKVDQNEINNLQVSVLNKSLFIYKALCIVLQIFLWQYETYITNP